MSDYSAYVRGRLEGHKKSQTGKFMKDGFDRWAESSTPARAGQMEKEPAESTNTMPRQMSEREVGGVLPLLAPAAIAAAPYVLPAAAGFATGIYAGVKGQRKVDAIRQQIAREERAKRGGGRFVVRPSRRQEWWSLYDTEARRVVKDYASRAEAQAAATQGGILPLLPAAAIAAAPYVLPAAAGFATGIYAGVKGQRKVDAVRQQIARDERAKYSGMGMPEGSALFGSKWEVTLQHPKFPKYWQIIANGKLDRRFHAESREEAQAEADRRNNRWFHTSGGAMPEGAGFREGVRETQNMYGNLADAAIYGYDTYEHAKKGFTGLPGALRSGAQVAEATLKVKDSAQRAAAEFQKGSGRVAEVAKHTFIPGYSTYVAAKTMKEQIKAARGRGKKVDTAVNLGVSGLAGYRAVQSGKQAKGAFEQGDYSGALRSGVDAAQMGLLSGVAARQAVKSATGKGKSDGRAARAAIVKQVMAERGVKMIEASKIVKAEGLY